MNKSIRIGRDEVGWIPWPESIKTNLNRNPSVKKIPGTVLTRSQNLDLGFRTKVGSFGFISET